MIQVKKTLTMRKVILQSRHRLGRGELFLKPLLFFSPPSYDYTCYVGHDKVGGSIK